jgi:hypothetical protein
MSNHFSGAMLKFPGDDLRLDLTDLFVSGRRKMPARRCWSWTSNPFMTGADFHPDAV